MLAKQILTNISYKVKLLGIEIPISITKPNYYSKSLCNTTTSTKTQNVKFLTAITRSNNRIPKKYEILLDIVTEYSGRSMVWTLYIMQNNSILLIVYYEVLEGQREEVKRKFENFITRNQLVLQ